MRKADKELLKAGKMITGVDINDVEPIDLSVSMVSMAGRQYSIGEPVYWLDWRNGSQRFLGKVVECDAEHLPKKIRLSDGKMITGVDINDVEPIDLSD